MLSAICLFSCADRTPPATVSTGSQSSGSSAGAEAGLSRATGWKSLDDLSEGRFAIFSGTVHDGFVSRTYPKASIVRFDSTATLVMSLKTDKVDVALLDTITAGLIMKTNPELGVLADNVLNMPLGVGFRKEDTDLRERFDRFIASIRTDGTYAAMHRRWCEDDPEAAKMPEINISGTGEKLTLGVSVEDLPYVAYMNGEYVGFDIEMMRRFAAHENLNMKIVMIDFPALVPALVSGKVDMITDGIAISEERAKMIGFSAPYAEFRTSAMAMRAKIARYSEEKRVQAAAKSPFRRIADSFHSNIILEKRWILILNGIVATMVMSVLSTILGTLLGALVCSMRMSPRTFPRTLASIYIAILRGMPVLVLLMLIYYVAFASVNINPIIVAVIAFGMNFGAYAAEIFRSGIESVDRGQTEAGIAMGFSKYRTFLYIVLPQATRRVLPVYRGEFISLVKTTSIVGYIGVQDLTKASDIIRSRTFDAFFPLVMVAVIYFFTTWLLGLFLDYIGRRTDPKFRRKAEAAL